MWRPAPQLRAQSSPNQFRRKLLRRAALQNLKSDKASIVALRGGAEHHDLRTGKLERHERDPSCRHRSPDNPGASLTRAPDQAAIGAEGSPPVNLDPADVHTHARFRTKRQLFLRFQAARLIHNLGVTHAPSDLRRRRPRSSNPFGGQSQQSERQRKSPKKIRSRCHRRTLSQNGWLCQSKLWGRVRPC